MLLPVSLVAAVASLVCALNAQEVVLGVSEAAIEWSSSSYPDLRGRSVVKCLPRLPVNRLVYVCDPDEVLTNDTQGLLLNEKLHELAVGTPCPCQRRSQCATGRRTNAKSAADGDDWGGAKVQQQSAGASSSSSSLSSSLLQQLPHGYLAPVTTQAPVNPSAAFHGFVVSIAIVRNLHMSIHSPSETQLLERAESFCRALEGRWALGDCGNSLIILVWQHYKKLVIWPSRLAEKYAIASERARIISDVGDLVTADAWFDALNTVVDELAKELRGSPETRTDTGTLALLGAVGVAVTLSFTITCCVCAFRWCGNVRNGATRNGSLRENGVGARKMRRDQRYTRSASRSPKFPTRDNPQRFFANENSII